MHFSTLFAATCAFISGTTAAPGLNPNLESRAVTPNAEGTHNGFFYSWWSDGNAAATYTNGNAGSYSISWEAGGNLVGGKGWNPGTSRSITYSANWKPVNNGNSVQGWKIHDADVTKYLTIYGWTRSPLIEYYVVEAHGEYNPSLTVWFLQGSSATSKGSVTIDGATYQLYQSTRYNAPSIDGTQTFQQYWAIRDSQRTSGTVNMGTVFNAWASKGMNLGTHYYQIVATEAYNSKGTSSVTVS
ncbi:unnamed protein product [Clonostachys byssicola]|uniref:Endo-1,4-beta-xylanase n=1 Tax=Clonostachys byssicola TaxID=160290 RepID=A0A9N9UJD1_9HYPO|nr:unnamed protein product [Clonostachys byssicola]